jgi:HlyD family secretion protein
LIKIKPDTYVANRNSEEARFKLAEANKELSDANLRKAEAEFTRNQQLYKQGIISESVLLDYKNLYEVAASSSEASAHQVDVARASLARAEEELGKTTIVAPLTGIITALNTEVGERVVGTAMMTGTEIMTVADLNAMEARVDIGEMDVVLIQLGQKARLEVDAFRDRKFSGIVTEIANSSRTTAGANPQQSQEATRFEVRIRFQDKAAFRTGMSVTADIETRYRTNVLAIPIQCVTTRILAKGAGGATNAPAAGSDSGSATNPPAAGGKRSRDKDAAEAKPVEVVFLFDAGKVKTVPVKRGISDEDYVEIVEGLTGGETVVSGGYKAISRELEDGMTVKVGEPDKPAAKQSG